MSRLYKMIISLLAIAGAVLLLVGFEGDSDLLPWLGLELMLLALIGFTVGLRQARLKSIAPRDDFTTEDTEAG